LFKKRKKQNSKYNRSLEKELKFRYSPEKDDCSKIRELVRKTGFFSKEEERVAIELIEEKLSLGSKSTYEFIFAEKDGVLVGYTCYGLIPLTKSSYDLYWIAVETAFQGGGIGRILLKMTENRIRKSGGQQLYSETSSRDQYIPTRKFYQRCGYKKGADFRDFYYPGDGKIIYYKML
jgi:D-alanine-D-alanine ligase